jgi:hypothetical protein
MSICIYKNKCNPAASAKNMEYITRDSAADSISFHNLPELEFDKRIDAKSNAINYAEERQLEEECRIRGNERGTPRNHNRMIISFDRKEETEIVKREVHGFLNKEFPNQRAVVTVHQDGKQSHAHIWFDIRDVDTGKKTQLPAEKFYTLDERWARQYDQKYGTEYAREYAAKKDRTFDFKESEYKRNGKQTGKKKRPEHKPERHADRKGEILRDKEIRDHGLEKSADRENQRLVSSGHSAIEESKRTLAERAGRGEQADRAADQTVQSTKTISIQIEQLPEQEFWDRDISRNYDIGR